ncbi:hypothetical protein [Jongsikchunia kroppenstedtii]|uniref:hypothetical protein n=1 Tax=Jongsikchunia kroppenstedtii TaxID=1121721 RepID=UPI001FE2267A|nr:hypothetical protein [Jongsikchunia kroppenstedtii]
MASLYHVSSALNRASIKEHGLDWRRMGSARGIAGSAAPEHEGCFLARSEQESRWFVRMNGTGGPVDVWQVDGIDVSELLTSAHGYGFFPDTIDPGQLTLIETDIPQERLDSSQVSRTPAFHSELVVRHIP